MNYDPSQPDPEPKGFWRSRYTLGLLVLGGIAGFFLLSEHRAHVFGALPYLLLLACPLMHLFMHGGHGGHRHGDGDSPPPAPGAGHSTKPGDPS